MSTILIEVDGNDITDDVVLVGATFSSQVNGVSGPCSFRVKDTDQTRSFTIGSRIRLAINSRNHWAGYLTKQSYVFAFDALAVDSETTRFFQIEGSDINILFEKRVTFQVADPADLEGPIYPTDTADTTAITDLLADWLDLSGDDLDTTSLVEHVGNINEDQTAQPFFGSWKWGEAMAAIARLPAAIFYIDPDRSLVYTDVDTPSVPEILTDQPHTTVSGVGYREMSFINDGGDLVNDYLAWGVGGASSTPVFSREEDATSIATHGRWQAGELIPGIYKQATIDRVTDAFVNGSPQSKRGRKDDRRRIDITTFNDSFRVSDKARFVSAVYGIDEVFPVRNETISFVGPTTPKFRLTLSFEIDAPYGLFDPFRFVFPPFGTPELPPIIDGWPPVTEDCVSFGLIVNETGGGVAYCTVTPGGTGCNSQPIVDVQIGKTFKLYAGSTYLVEYRVHHGGNDGPVQVGIQNGEFLGTTNMGSSHEGTAITFATATITAGFDRDYWFALESVPFAGFDTTGLQGEATIFYVSGSDPRFFGFTECPEGTDGSTTVGPPGSGFVCQEIAPEIDGMTLITFTHFIAGTETVRLNGTTQIPGLNYIAYPMDGQIVLSQPVSNPGDRAWVCYEVQR